MYNRRWRICVTNARRKTLCTCELSIHSPCWAARQRLVRCRGSLTMYKGGMVGGGGGGLTCILILSLPPNATDRAAWNGMYMNCSLGI